MSALGMLLAAYSAIMLALFVGCCYYAVRIVLARRRIAVMEEQLRRARELSP